MRAETDTIIGRLVANRVRHADKQVLVTEAGALTHADLDDASRKLGARLIAAGVQWGDRVGLVAPNSIEWATIAMAVGRIGAVLVPMSTLLRPSELVSQVRTARVTHLLSVETFRGRRYLDELEAELGAAPGALADANRHAVVPSLRAAWAVSGLPVAAVDLSLVDALGAQLRSADDLVILFTSGSSGTPKGVIHTHGGALRATQAGLASRGIADDDRLYVSMPFFWTGGFASGLITVIVAGATLLTESHPEPRQTLTMLERERVTLFRGWPDQAVSLAHEPTYNSVDLSALRDGSLPAILPPDRRPRPGSRALLFGMTETFGPYCGYRSDVDLPEDKFGSCGKPFDGIEVRVVDPDSGETCPEGGPGEIWIRGRNMMRGICGRPRSSVFTIEGYYRTGDLGRLDGDGFLWYEGRLDDMFKVKGATVYPSEVEAALLAIDGVRQVVVSPVDIEGAPTEVGAVVVSDHALTDIVAGLRARLSSFKVPTRWLVTSDAGRVPAFASGKVNRRAVAQLLADEADTADVHSS